MGAIHLTKDDQRVLMDALRFMYEGHGPAPTHADLDRAERLYRAIAQYDLEDTPT